MSRQITRHKYFISFELPNSEREEKRSWLIAAVERPIDSTEDLTQMLSHILIVLEETEPILPLNVSYLGEVEAEVPEEVLLYQMGKVGSVSIRDAINQLDEGIRVIHVHYIMDYGEYGAKFDERLYNRIMTEDKTWLIISMVRNVFSRDISGFFWSLEQYYSGDPTIYNQAMVDDFVYNYPHQWTLEWFDNELSKLLDYDIYSKPFNTSRGFSYYGRDVGPKPHFNLLVMQTEVLSDVGPEAIYPLLKSTVTMSKKNQTEKRRAVSQQRAQFMMEAVFPQDFIDEMLGSKYMQHFYSPEDRELLRKFWSEPRIKKP